MSLSVCAYAIMCVDSVCSSAERGSPIKGIRAATADDIRKGARGPVQTGETEIERST